MAEIYKKIGIQVFLIDYIMGVKFEGFTQSLLQTLTPRMQLGE